MVISDFESGVWHENADCSPIMLAGRKGYQGWIGYLGTHNTMFVSRFSLTLKALGGVFSTPREVFG